MSRRWVLNASPTILLAKIGFLEHLLTLCPQPVIPQGVYEEILVGTSDDPARRWLSRQGKLSFFYYLWRYDKLKSAEALRQAQIRLRDSTPEQRIAFFRELLSEAAVTELDAVLSQDFSHPYHWAGFGMVDG